MSDNNATVSTVQPPARWWIITAPDTGIEVGLLSSLPEPVVYAKGQIEIGNGGGLGQPASEGGDIRIDARATDTGDVQMGEGGGYRHLQAVLCTKRPVRVSQLKRMFMDTWHFERTRSSAANAYVWKEETRVPGTQFEVGSIPLKRNDKTDWDKIKQLAMEGKLEEMESQIYVCHYRSLKAIAYDHLKPDPMVRIVNVYWGLTGVGKSRRAWQEAGFHAYPKDPRTKFWDGYRGHENVVIDEFRGDIDIAHLLRWFDRYPVNVEVKGSAVVLSAKRVWITSNIDPRKWYPNVDEATLNALLRRLNIVHMLDNMLQ